MKAEEKNKEVDINEAAMSIEVNPGAIERVRSGEVGYITLQICEDNQHLVLENMDGMLILNVDEKPTTYHSCYLYNHGEFPYFIKRSLQFLLLTEEDGKNCLVQIIGTETEPTVRFNYQGAGLPIMPASNGTSCIWEVSFEVLPVPEKPKKYLMRWNPAISSFKEKDYEACVANMKNGMFRMNWSIYEWEEARRGDCFYMMRVGDDKAGIVFNGQFLSDPYPSDDWAGTTKRRMYVDMVCRNPETPGEVPFVSLEKLKAAIPSIDWGKGHSGALLSDEVSEKLLELWDEGSE
ncbi:MAG: hypothetical protein J5616_08690 [Bacteroidaceae bacterium]|nr:hypothetical protein [Bacteroidaceae bacterium]